MMFSLTWLPEVLEAAGLKVAETEGWRTRGRGPMGTVRGVMCHHTATAAPGNMPSLRLLKEGRPDLAGPLAQLGLGRDGTFYVIAAGRANHAGAGSWEGLTTGNSSFIGIEAENDGVDEAWPDVQIEAYQRGVAAILQKIGASAKMCAGHKEYAPKRKSDPDFDMIAFRRMVAAFLQGKSPRPPIASEDDESRPTLRRGAEGPDVARAQDLLGLADPDGKFGPGTEAAVRAYQRDHELVPDGIIGPASWNILEPQAPPAAAPAPAAPAPAPAAPGAVPAAPGVAVAKAAIAKAPAFGKAAIAKAPAFAKAAIARPPAVATAPAAPGDPSLPVVDTPRRPARKSGRSGLTPDGKPFAKVMRLGFKQDGSTTIAEWLDGLPAPPPHSPSTIRLVKAVSVNEGRFEAINSYDSAILSCGIQQWTVGQKSAAGELAYLLAALKHDDPAAFEECFGRYGLDVSTQGFGGRLSIGGKELRTPADKAALRDVAWAYRFWRAAHSPAVRLAQFSVAAGRIARFHDVDVVGHPLRAWITSERGIAHLLDEHVNRPGHVPGTLAQAVERIHGNQIPDPKSLDEAAETALIDAYLAIRALPAKGAMTDSAGRAARIDAFVTRDELSSERDSYRP